MAVGWIKQPYLSLDRLERNLIAYPHPGDMTSWFMAYKYLF